MKERLKRWLHRWLESGEDRVLAPLEGQVPASDALTGVKLAYWTDVLAATKSKDGKRLLHRVQILYNLSQLELLRTDPRDTAKLATAVAKMQGFWEILTLEAKATNKISAYTSDSRKLQEEDEAELR